jgi:2-dehydropantoate 2-reductase
LAEAFAAVQLVQGRLFLNGIDHLQQMDRLFGKERVMAGAAYVSTKLTEIGSIQQPKENPNFVIGIRHDAQKVIAEKLKQLSGKAVFDSILSHQIEQAMWDKCAILATLTVMTTLM